MWRDSFNGIEIPILSTFAETLMAVAHAVCKERIYALNNYVTVGIWFLEKCVKLAEKLRCIDAINKVLAVQTI